MVKKTYKMFCMNNNLNTPSIILIRPQMGENIGAAARAMLNFGLSDLRLVAPRDGWPNQAAFDTSSGALNKIPPPQIFEHSAESLADCHYTYGTTARSRDMVKPAMDASAAAADAQARIAQGQKIAFIFGPERTGLENDDLALCNAVVHIPTNPDFSSLNLGQSVLLLAYEWRMTHENAALSAEHITDTPPPAAQGDLHHFFERLEEELEKGRFFRDEDLKPTMIRNIRNMFMKMNSSEQELRTMHGIISALIGKKQGSKD